MRRAIAIFAILVFVSPLTVPALVGLVPTSLPSCCLRNGSHHCTESGSIPDSNEDGFQTQPVKCPVRCCAVTPSGTLYAPAVAELRFELVVADFASGQPIGQCSLFLAYSHFERGPPTPS